MERGQLSEMQRNIAWEGKSQSEREATTAFNLNLSGEENARNAGILATGAGQQRETEYAERKSREERFRDTLLHQQLSSEAQATLGALNDYGNQLRTELERRQRRTNELNDRIEASETLLILLSNDELDRDNPYHLELLERAGLDPDLDDDELSNRAEDTLNSDRQELNANEARIAEIERQLPLVEVARERIENGEDPDAVLRDLADQGIHIEVDPTDELQVRREVIARGQDLDAERQDRQPAMEAADSAVTEDQPSLDDEVETFMRALANNQQMMLEGSALHDAMRGQIDGLSDEAREQLEATEETAFLFEQNEVQPAVPAQDPTAPIEDHRPDQSPGITPGSNL